MGDVINLLIVRKPISVYKKTNNNFMELPVNNKM